MDSELSSTVFVLSNLSGPNAGVSDEFRIGESNLVSEFHQRVDVAQERPFGEVGLMEARTGFTGEVLSSSYLDKPVGIKGIGWSSIIDVPLQAQFIRRFTKSQVGLIDLVTWLPVFGSHQFTSAHRSLSTHPGIEFKGPGHNHHVGRVIKGPQGGVQLRISQVAVGTDHITPHLDEHNASSRARRSRNGHNSPMTARDLSVSDAVNLIRPVDTVGLGLVTGTPKAILTEMSRRTDWENLTVSGGLLLGRFDLFERPGVHYRATFFGAGERYYRDQGADIQFVPSFFRHYGLLCQDINARVMLMQASMPDDNGNISLSLYSGAHLEECRRAARDPGRLLILECSPHFPRTRALEGHPHTLHIDAVDVIVVSDERPTELAKEDASEVDRLIAENSMPFIPDGATLQTGIGAVPNLVALALAAGSGGDYGVHSEMFTDGLYSLYAAGKITNSRKAEHRGYSVTTFALGSAELYQFLDENDEVRFAPVTYTNDPAVIARNPRMVSINSALEVDLQGQILAEAIGPRQFSGTGGHMDFLEGTSLSREHCSIIALQSTAKVKGELTSRIVGGIGPHSVVTSPRHLAQVIVTEYGAADLRGRSVKERALALAEIAHPQFRDGLRDAATLVGC